MALSLVPLLSIVFWLTWTPARLAMKHHQYAEAQVLYEETLRQNPNDAAALNELAWLLVTRPGDSKGDPAKAVELARRAVALRSRRDFIDTLVCAQAATGNFESALFNARAMKFASRVALFEKKQICAFDDSQI
jgi:tetratricopeptide (TPR) repeat protein